MQPVPVQNTRPQNIRPTRVRYVVLGMTVAAYMITYMDRTILAVARPVIRDELGISLLTMGTITGAFRIAYALFQIPGGWFGDRFGARRALSLIVAWWSLFTGLTAMAWNAASMLVIQVLFGMGEAGAFPIATRSLARWMRPTERGFAQGITHAGSRLGAALTPLMVVPLIALIGWRGAFWVFAALGVTWAAVWYFYYRDTPEEHAGVNQAERDLIGSGRKRSTRCSVAADSFAQQSVDPRGDVFLLQLQSQRLQRLVSDLSARFARHDSGEDGHLRESSAVRGNAGRYRGR